MASRDVTGLGATDPARLSAESRLGRKDRNQILRTLRVSVRMVRAAGGRTATLLFLLQVLAVCALVAQVLLGRAVLQSLDQPESAALDVLLGALAVSVALGQALSATVTQQQRLLSERVVRHVWDQLLRVASRVRLEVFEDPDFHDRLQRVRSFALSRPLEVTGALSNIMSSGLTAAGLLAFLVAVEPALVPLLLLIGLPLLVLGRRSSRAEYRFSLSRILDLRRRTYITRILTEDLSSKEVRAFDLADPLAQRYSALHDEHVRALEGHVRRQGLWALLASALAAVGLGGTFLLLLALVRAGRLSLPEAAVAAVVIRLLAARLQALAAAATSLFGAGLFLDDLVTFLEQPVPARRQPAPSGRTLSVSLSQVVFTYPRQTSPALVEVDLHVGQGEIVALVGENGSGKTTLAKLLAGLYVPTSGLVRWEVDGRPLDSDEVQDHLTVLFQDFARYELSLRDNVALGRVHEPVDDARVRECLRTAGLGPVLESLPAGLDTVLSRSFPGGRELSGGQWQRVALARCLYRDAPLVVLDEPTSALDPRAEHDLFADMRSVLGGRSVVLVSHRFSNVRSADRIVVLEAGRVSASGTHEELMAAGGRYADLYQLQARAYGTLDAPAR